MIASNDLEEGKKVSDINITTSGVLSFSCDTWYQETKLNVIRISFHVQFRIISRATFL